MERKILKQARAAMVRRAVRKAIETNDSLTRGELVQIAENFKLDDNHGKKLFGIGIDEAMRTGRYQFK